MPSTQLQRTAVTSTENYKYTFSAWVKRTGVLGSSSVNEVLFSNWNDSSNSAYIRFEDINDNLHVYDQYNAGPDLNYQTNMKFRDPNAWYHIVVNVDGTRSANTRCKIYVNGSEVSCFNTTDTGGTLAMKTVTTTNAMRLGAIRTASGAEYYFSGLMSHVHYIDGTGYDASYFGETDSTTGEWKIKTNVTGVNYGNNGFFVLKDGTNLSGSTVQDQSGNSNNFSVSAGTLTKTEDNPSNVFTTINPLFVNDDAATNALTKGNNTYTSTTRGEWNNMTSTLGAITGKYYWEVKYEQLIDASTIYMSSEGVASDLAPANHNLGEGTRSGYGYGWLCGNRNTTSNTRYLKTVNGTATLTTDSNNTPVVAGDIVGVAWDATNGKLWFHKNGTYIDDTSGYVGNPTTAAYPYHTGMQTGILYTVWSDVWQNASGSLLIKSYNFGNGYFGTTAVSSAGTNASGNGIFEYDVPTGYTALSTKGLNL